MVQTLLADDDIAKRRKHPLRRRLSVFLPSDLVTALLTPRRNSLALLLSLVVLVILAIYFVVILFSGGRGRSGHQALKWGGEAKNWGDYVGLGLARTKILEQTPSNYAELGDKWTGGAGALYQAYVEPGSVDLASLVQIEGEGEKESTLMREGNFESDGRRGIYGGASTEWSSGVVGMGQHLGNAVDMRKLPLPIMDEIVLPARTTLVRHILAQGWSYLDATDEANTLKLLAEAEASRDFASLPLRDRVRGNEKAMSAAAVRWSRIYGAEEGEGRKSALEVAVEKLVRRAPVVIFSKTTCPFVSILALLVLALTKRVTDTRKQPRTSSGSSASRPSRTSSKWTSDVRFVSSLPQLPR